MFIGAVNLHKSYKIGNKYVEILKGINLSINFREFVAIVGSSGSGKSTLLYHLALLDTPSSGKVIINNDNMNNLSSKEKTKIRLKYMGYIFQDYNLLPYLKLYENVALVAIADGMNIKKAFKRAKEVLTMVGLGGHVSKRPSQLSGGQQQRVAIARALVNKPLILFADEPTANLDSKTSMEIFNLFRELNVKHHLTIVMVTHEEEFKSKVDRIIKLKDGMVI